MNIVLAYILPCVAAYLIGAIPFGLLIAKSRGIDIRKVGSGNIGATNVLRTVGKTWGILTLLADVLKGFLPAIIFPMIIEGLDFLSADPLFLRVLCGCLAVCGHSWPVYLGFKGGKGVATSAGALLAIAPLGIAFGLGTWILVFTLGRYVSLASMAAALAMAVFAWVAHHTDPKMVRPVALSLLAILVLWRHRENMKRLLNGTEYKFKKKARPDDE